MKHFIFLLLAVAVCQSAPVEESSAKTKRGLHLGLGYHAAPVLAHSYVSAPVYHAAPVISHAPIISHAPFISHAPLVAHAAPIYSSHHILPSFHSIHHY